MEGQQRFSRECSVLQTVPENGPPASAQARPTRGTTLQGPSPAAGQAAGLYRQVACGGIASPLSGGNASLTFYIIRHLS